MTRARTVALGCAVLATAAAIGFLSLSVDRNVYAPGARTLQQGAAHAADWHGFLASYAFGSAIWHVLRKIYSVGAFAVLGFLLAPLFARARRVRSAGLFVAGFSAVIELVQKVSGSDESLASNLFDIGCGLAGGWLGAALWNAIVDRRRDKG